MRSTQQIRDLWDPHCTAEGRHGVSLLPAYQARDDIMRKYGYAPRAGVTGAANCRPITGGTNYSLHAYAFGEKFTHWNGTVVSCALAEDVNWDRNQYGKQLVTDMPRAMVDEICAIRTVDGLQVWRWGGYYSGNKDAMHYEVVVSPAELARGIAGRPAYPTQGGFLMALTDAEQAELLKKVRDTDVRSDNIQKVASKLDALIPDLTKAIAHELASTSGGSGGPWPTEAQVEAACTRAIAKLRLTTTVA